MRKFLIKELSIVPTSNGINWKHIINEDELIKRIKETRKLTIGIGHESIYDCIDILTAPAKEKDEWGNWVDKAFCAKDEFGEKWIAWFREMPKR
ncbi:hypothetical protein KAR91_42775 [Candidatus Pacearchaeota archaeon]|nr:hypothetical protein [Candidatus Pacearchaeota archaeon]